MFYFPPHICPSHLVDPSSASLRVPNSIPSISYSVVVTTDSNLKGREKAGRMTTPSSHHSFFSFQA